MTDLPRTAANYVPLSPLSYLRRAAAVFPDKPAVIHGARRYTYAQFYERCRRLADGLRRVGVGVGDTVAVLAPNVPVVLEANFGVPMAGAIVNALNYRLDAASIGFILRHGQAKVLLVDPEFALLAQAALAGMETPPLVIDVVDHLAPPHAPIGRTDYETFLAEAGDADSGYHPADEWETIALNYTSGTTGNPKGAALSHRGAYLAALGNAFSFGLDENSVYLWTLPMFHCNGWTFTWAVVAAAATHVCLRRVEVGPVFAAVAEHGVTHMCGAPIVLNMLARASGAEVRRPARSVKVATGGAAPPSAVIEAMEKLGFRITHLYGLTESYGPATLCLEDPAWAEQGLEYRARQVARQGMRYVTMEGLRVVDPVSGEDVPSDGQAIGEMWLRGNTLMKGYLGNPAATAEAFRDGWFHTGDLAVMHPDGYIEIKDRAKDIIISGGENISSLEIEEALYRHPAVLEAAVVAKPDPHWGETPCAFIVRRPEAADVTGAAIVAWLREQIAHYKLPHFVVFEDLPKTSTGKIQKTVLREKAKAVPAEAKLGKARG